jgi:hypothetical protein
MAMELKKTSLFFLGLIASLVPVGFGADTVPSNIRIVLPPEMAARLTQGALGQPLPNGDSRVTIPVKKPIHASAKKVLIKNLPIAVSNYASKIFKLNFSEPFKLDIRIFGLKPSGDVRIKSLHFSEPAKSNGRVLIDVDLEIRRLIVDANEVWVVERGLTPGVAPATGVGCPVEKKKIDAFSKNQIGARVVAPKIHAKNLGSDEVPISVQGRFEAEYASTKLGTPREFRLKAISVKHNVAAIVNSSYRLDAELDVPPVVIFLDGECYPDTNGGRAINELFQSMLDPIKQEILSGISETITQTAIEEATKEFEALKIPVEKDFSPERVDSRIIQMERPEVVRMSTAVASPLRKEMARDFNSSNLPTLHARVSGPKNSKLPKNLIWQFNEKLMLGSLGTNPRGDLNLELGDQLSLNARTEAAILPSDEGLFPPQDPNHLRIVINHSFFESKIDLLASLREEQGRILPSGVSLSKNGIEVHPNSGNRISVVPQVDVHLKELPGIAGVAASLVESIAGNTGGIYHVPLQIDLHPEVLATSDGRVLRLNLSVYENLIENAFGDHSNLDQASSLVLKILKKKLRQLAAKIKSNPIDIDLGPLEDKTPLKVARLVFSNRGSLAIDLEVSSIRELFGKNKKTEDSVRPGVAR